MIWIVIGEEGRVVVGGTAAAAGFIFFVLVSASFTLDFEALGGGGAAAGGAVALAALTGASFCGFATLWLPLDFNFLEVSVFVVPLAPSGTACLFRLTILWMLSAGKGLATVCVSNVVDVN